jgi:small GTP-binding protein
MNITDYAQAKFEIGDLLRMAAVKARELNPDDHYPFEDLFARLAEDRFNIAVIGQFSRGKTSLMNAMLNTDRLPTGIVPLTSVITTVQYGPKEVLKLEYQGQRMAYEAPLDDITQYVSQAHNPGNEKHIKYARVDLPAELLRKGFVLVDTPGLGSPIKQNTRTTEDFLPEADAFILVTSYESPLSSEEHKLLQSLKAFGYRIFVVVNKRDLVSSDDQLAANRHICEQLSTIFGDHSPQLFSMSAREALNAQKSGSAAGYNTTGLPEFIDSLVGFLLEERQKEFLGRLIGRVRTSLESVGTCQEELGRLAKVEKSLFTAAVAPATLKPFADLLRTVPGRFTACDVCREVEAAAWDFLTMFQYDITIDPHQRAKLAAAGGLCAFHTWQYAAIADAHGTCIAFPEVIDQFADRLSAFLDTTAQQPPHLRDWRPSRETCVYCRRCADAEDASLTKVALRIEQTTTEANYPKLCFPHLAKLCDKDGLSPDFLHAQLQIWKRVAEDMRRYALNRDGLRRAFSTADELDSNIRGLRLLAGHRSLSYPPPLDR